MVAARYAGYLRTLRPIVLPHTDPVCYSKPAAAASAKSRGITISRTFLFRLLSCLLSALLFLFAGLFPSVCSDAILYPFLILLLMLSGIRSAAC